MENITDVVTTDELIGVKVQNHAGEKIGSIDKLVLDKTSGKTCYAALSVGGFLGIGEKLVAVPWKALHYDKTQECFILDADKDKLLAAGTLSKDWSDWSDKRWGENLHREYDVSPYWENDPEMIGGTTGRPVSSGANAKPRRDK